MFFQGPILGTVLLTSGDVAPALVENPVALPACQVGVFLTATQSVAHGTLTAKISAELVAEEGPPPSPGLDLRRDGTFARATEGGYQVGSPTNGALPFLAWADADIRRVEDRGDGLGPMLLVEGTRTNLVYPSRDPQPSATWSAGTGSMSYTEDTGPDGAKLAARGDVTSAQYGSYANVSLTAYVPYAGSSWARRRTGAGSGVGQMSIRDSISALVSTDTVPLTETGWARIEYAGLSKSTGTGAHFPWQGTAAGGGKAEAMDFLGDLQQVEEGLFASSPIRTTVGPVTRAADTLQYAAGAYPSSFLTRGFRMVVAPDFPVPTVGDSYLLSFDPGLTSGCVLLSGGVLSVYVPGVGFWVTHTGVTCARAQPMTIEVCPAGGMVTLSGASSGNGTTIGAPWAFLSGALHVGTLDGGSTGPFFGRISAHIAML